MTTKMWIRSEFEDKKESVYDPIHIPRVGDIIDAPYEVCGKVEAVHFAYLKDALVINVFVS